MPPLNETMDPSPSSSQSVPVSRGSASILETSAAANTGIMTDRLILVTAAYLPDSFGGAERQAQILAPALARRGCRVTLVAPTVSSDAPLHEETDFGEIRRIRVRAYPNLGGRNIGTTIHWTRQIVRMFDPKIWRGVPVYVFHARLHALGAAMLAQKLRSPLLLKLGGGGESSDFRALDQKRFFYGRAVKRHLLQRVDRFVANSGQIADDLMALGVPSARVVHFPNGVHLPDRTTIEDTLQSRTGHRFIFTGRIIRDKNVHLLCDAVAQVARTQDIFLEMVGDGPDRSQLHEKVTREHLEKHFQFPGYAADVYPKLFASDFFISASTREGQSNSLLEAMSAGCIPIVAGASGVSDVVQHGANGFIVNPVSPQSLENAITLALRLSKNDRLKMAWAARETAEQLFGIDAVAGKTLDSIP